MIDRRPVLIDHPEGAVIRIDDEAFKVAAKRIEGFTFFPRKSTATSSL